MTGFTHWVGTTAGPESVPRRQVTRLLAELCVGPAPRWFAGSLAIAVTAAISMSAYPYGLKLITDGLIAHRGPVVAWGTVLVAGLYSIGWAAGVLGANIDFGLIDRTGLHVSTAIAERVNAVRGTGHLDDPDYQRELDLLREKQAVLAGFPRQVLSVVQIVLRAGIVMVLMGLIYPPLALLPLAGVAPYLGERFSARLRSSAERATSSDKRLSDKMFAIGVDPAAAVETRMFGLSGEILDRHAAALGRVVARTGVALRRGAAAGVAGWVVFAAVFMLGVGVVLLRTTRGESTPGELLLAMTLLRRVQVQFTQVSGLTTNLATAAGAARRLVWLGRCAGSGARGSGGPAPERLHRGLELDGVGFAFDPATPVLRDVRLSIPAGSVVALVGENGAGKSTLIKLLARMYEPTEGRITVDGVDLAATSADDWRRRMSGAFQDYVRYELTCGQNVGVGDLPRMDDGPAVLDALNRAGGAGLATELAAGLGTEVGRSFGKKAVDLSGGQWQQVALGRGVLREEPLLVVFDEPTAALDPAAEHALFDRFSAAARDLGRRTGAITVLVSHRFSTVLSADVIVVLERGRLREAGSHAELMAAGGAYAELFALQARAYA